jgi:hypothetical protein
MTTVYSISPIQQAIKNWCPGHDHSVLNITKQQAIKIDVQAMTTVYSISPIQQAIKIDVQAMTTVYSISPNNRLCKLVSKP